MTIIDVHGESWLVCCRWLPWNLRLRLFGWDLVRAYWAPEFSELFDLVVRPVVSVVFVLLGVLEALAAAVALPAVLLLRLVGVMTTTVEVREYGPRSRKPRESRAVWTVPVRGWRRAHKVRDRVAEFVRTHGNDGELHRRLAHDPQARDFETAADTA